MKVNGINIPNITYSAPSSVSFKSEDKTVVSNPAVDKKEIKADASAAIKAQLGVKTPVTYKFIGDFEIPQAGNAKLYKLSNGQKVVILNKKGPTVLKSYFNVGSMNEPDNIRGVSHFDEHMAFNGTENLEAGDFFKITNNMGAITNASTGFSMTDYFISSQLLNPSDFEESLRIHSEMLQKPKYDPEMIEKEKGPVTSEISMVGDVPTNMALNNCIKNLFRINTDSPDLVAGTIRNIQNLNRDDAYNYYNTWYTPDNCITVITGEVEPDKTMALVSKYFNSSKSGKPENRKYEEFKPITTPVRKDIKMAKASGTTISLGFAGPTNSAEKENIELKLLMMALLGNKGTRLSKALDDIQTGAMFSIERMGNRPQDPRAILFVGQSTPEKSEKVIAEFYNQITKLVNNPLTEDELNSAKNMLKLGYANLCENSQLLNSFIGTSLIDNDLNYAKNYLNILDSVTTEDLTNFAKKYLDLNKASLSVVHPANLDDKTISENYMKVHKKTAPSFKGRIEDKTFDLSKIKEYRLSNNMEAAFNPNKSDLVSMGVNFDTKIPANVKPAVPILLSILLTTGSKDKNFNAFYDDLNKQGIELRFKADFTSMSADVNALAKDVPVIFDKIKEVITSPRFNENSLKYAKALLKENLLNSENSAADSLLREMFPNSPDFAAKEELLKSLQEVNLEDIRAFYNYIMQNAQASAIITGPVDRHPELIDSALSGLNFGSFKPQKVVHFDSYMPITSNKVITKAEERNQADIIQGFKFKTNYNPKDQITIKLMNTILGDGPYSRLFNDLREKQKLAYRVESNIDYHGNTGVLTLGIKTTTDNKAENIKDYDNVTKSLAGFKKHIEMLKTQKVTEEELNAAKLRLKTKILNAIESSGGQTNVLEYSKNSFFSFATTQKSLELIDKITAEDIYNAANYIFNSNSVTSILASKDTLDNICLKA